MHLTYRGIRYEVQPSNTDRLYTTLRKSPLKDKPMETLLPPTVTLKYRGSDYLSCVQKSTSSTSDPDLESFIAAFWAIVDA